MSQPGNPIKVRIPQDPPTDPNKNNPSFDLTYDADNQCIRIDMIIEGITYRKTLTWDSGGHLIGITEWSVV